MIQQPILPGDIVEYHGTYKPVQGKQCVVTAVPPRGMMRGYILKDEKDSELWNVHRDSIVLVSPATAVRAE